MTESERFDEDQTIATLAASSPSSVQCLGPSGHHQFGSEKHTKMQLLHCRIKFSVKS